MKIVIADYRETLNRDLDYEAAIVKKMLPEAQIVIYEYHNDKEEFKQVIKDADAVKTAFIMMDRDLIDSAGNLKCISFGSAGYNNVDLPYASEKKIAVLAVPEYCTEEVADHAVTLMLALNKNLKIYEKLVEEGKWRYRIDRKVHSLQSQTLGIVGFGKIGQAVAKRALVFGMNVKSVSSHLSKTEAAACGVIKVELEELLETCDIISNHMKLTPQTKGYFNFYLFLKMKKKPLFINVGRGGTVVENDLIKALDRGLIRGAGLDVLEKENPELSVHPLVGRENVIITPHAAFYSEEAIKKLHTISTENMIYYLKGEYEKVFIVNHI